MNPKFGLLTAGLLLFAFPILSPAQGYVNFANTVATRVSIEGTLQPLAPIGSWYYALLVAPSTKNTLDTITFDGWTYVALATNRAVAGRLTGNNVDGGSAVQIFGGEYTAPGNMVDFAVVGWSGNIGSDWNTVRAGWHGYSDQSSWSITDPGKPGGSNNVWFAVSVVAQDIVLQPFNLPYNSVFGSAAFGQIPGVNFLAVPEPSSFSALTALTGMILVLRRPHQKQQQPLQ